MGNSDDRLHLLRLIVSYLPLSNLFLNDLTFFWKIDTPYLTKEQCKVILMGSNFVKSITVAVVAGMTQTVGYTLTHMSQLQNKTKVYLFSFHW